MSKQLLLTLAAGVVIIGAALYSTIALNQGHLLTLTGTIDNIRVSELSSESNLVLLDFTAHNPSKVTFEIKDLKVDQGDVLSKAETSRFLEFKEMPHPNPSLGIGDRIRGGETVKRLVAARFDAPVAGLESATYTIRFTHIENVEAEITGHK